VTNKEYCRYNPNHNVPDNLPVVNVSWYDAVLYCNWLSEEEGLDKCYSDEDGDGLLDTMDINQNGYRLPAEEEWEYACRAGTTTEYYWGNEMDGEYCWYCDNSYDVVHPVGQKMPNSWELYDMSGNVSEWCDNLYGYPLCFYSNYAGFKADLLPGIEIFFRNDDLSYSSLAGLIFGNERVSRGGSWSDSAWNCSSGCRGYSRPNTCNNSLGFRVVRNF